MEGPDILFYVGKSATHNIIRRAAGQIASFLGRKLALSCVAFSTYSYG